MEPADSAVSGSMVQAVTAAMAGPAGVVDGSPYPGQNGSGGATGGAPSGINGGSGGNGGQGGFGGGG